MIRLDVNFKKKYQNPSAKRSMQATRIESEKTTTATAAAARRVPNVYAHNETAASHNNIV